LKAEVLSTRSPDYSRSKTSQQNPQIRKLSGATTLIPTTYGIYQAYFDASYEVDIFGGVRNQVKAARADAAAGEEDLRNTLVSALAEVARDYIQLREYQEQFHVAKQNEASQLDTLKITQVRNKAASDIIGLGEVHPWPLKLP